MNCNREADYSCQGMQMCETCKNLLMLYSKACGRSFSVTEGEGPCEVEMRVTSINQLAKEMGYEPKAFYYALNDEFWPASRRSRATALKIKEYLEK